MFYVHESRMILQSLTLPNGSLIA